MEHTSTLFGSSHSVFSVKDRTAQGASCIVSGGLVLNPQLIFCLWDLGWAMRIPFLTFLEMLLALGAIVPSRPNQTQTQDHFIVLVEGISRNQATKVRGNLKNVHERKRF